MSANAETIGAHEARIDDHSRRLDEVEGVQKTHTEFIAELRGFVKGARWVWGLIGAGVGADLLLHLKEVLGK
jgi:hypothetical protein